MATHNISFRIRAVMAALLLTAFFCHFSQQVSAQPTSDSIKDLNTKVDKIDATVKAVSNKTDSIATGLQAMKTDFNTHVEDNTDKPKGFEIFLVLLPAILFLLFFIFLQLKINLTELIREAIKDKSSPAKTITQNIAAQPAVYKEEDGVKIMIKDAEHPTTIVTTSDYGKSTSRIVLFFSSALSLIIAVCFVSVFIYGYFAGKAEPDYSALVNVLLSLGIGVVPYAVNQIAKPGSANNSGNTAR